MTSSVTHPKERGKYLRTTHTLEIIGKLTESGGVLGSLQVLTMPQCSKSPFFLLFLNWCKEKMKKEISVKRRMRRRSRRRRRRRRGRRKQEQEQEEVEEQEEEQEEKKKANRQTKKQKKKLQERHTEVENERKKDNNNNKRRRNKHYHASIACGCRTRVKPRSFSPALIADHQVMGPDGVTTILAPPTLPAGQRCRPPQSHGTWPGMDEKKNRNRVGKGDGGRGVVIKGWAARQQPPVLGSVDQRDESEQMLRALSWCPTLRVFDSFVRCGRYCRVSALRHWKRQSVVVETDVCLVGR